MNILPAYEDRRRRFSCLWSRAWQDLWQAVNGLPLDAIDSVLLLRHELLKGAVVFRPAPGVGAPAMALAQESGLAEVAVTKFLRQPVDPADGDGCQAGEDGGEVDGELGWEGLIPARRAGGTYFHFADGDDWARERGGEVW